MGCGVGPLEEDEAETPEEGHLGNVCLNQGERRKPLMCDEKCRTK